MARPLSTFRRFPGGLRLNAHGRIVASWTGLPGSGHWGGAADPGALGERLAAAAQGGDGGSLTPGRGRPRLLRPPWRVGGPSGPGSSSRPQPRATRRVKSSSSGRRRTGRDDRGVSPRSGWKSRATPPTSTSAGPTAPFAVRRAGWNRKHHRGLDRAPPAAYHRAPGTLLDLIPVGRCRHDSPEPTGDRQRDGDGAPDPTAAARS